MNIPIIPILAEAAGPSGASSYQPFIMMGLMVVMFYFLLIRPQQKQRKELQQRIDSMQAGDRVITSAGIHGLVHNIREKTVVVKIADNTMVEFDKAAMAIVVKKDA
jgi:preprotein translocase subunit YajC